MSNLLNEAIVDAKALREAALKNAETAVIEKYSQEVKETLDNLLEQDELGLEGAPEDAAMPDLGATEGAEGAQDTIDEDNEIPLAATDGFADLDGKNLKDFPASGEPVDLGVPQEIISRIQGEKVVPSTTWGMKDGIYRKLK